MKKTPTPKPQKTNPRCSTLPPVTERFLAGLEWRSLIREVLAGKGRGLADVEKMLGSFAPSYVRGDFVPTIPDAYAQLVAIAHEADISTPETALAAEPAIVALTVPTFSPDGSFRVEVRLVPALQKPKSKTP